MIMTRLPSTEIDSRFSSPDATPTDWSRAAEMLESAEIFWISTVRADGQPHVTPLIAVWTDDALFFTTGPDEQKARNLSSTPRCTITTGCNLMGEGLDIVIEGVAERVRDVAMLNALADRIVSKYGEGWRFSVHDDVFQHDHGSDATIEAGGVTALAFRIQPDIVFGFARGDDFSQTAFRFKTPGGTA